MKDRKKKKEETSTEYLYEMLALSSNSHIDKAAIITYTIEGLPGSMESKSFMFKAETISEFKRKLQAYDLMMSKKQKTKEELYQKNGEKLTTKKPGEIRCYNCGDKHLSNECPSKDLKT